MTEHLPVPLQENPFTYREAIQHGLTQYSLKKLLESGDIERIERGVYQATGTDLSEEELYRRAVKKVGEPASVCLLSALSHYHLTDTIPKQVWLIVPVGKRSKSRGIRLYRSREPNWDKGIIRAEGYHITNVERSILDSLVVKKLLSPRFGIDALKKAVQKGQTTPDKILHMADLLNVKHRVLQYIEALT